MQRREFITLLGGAAAAWPLVAHAQQSGQMRRIGVLLGGAESDPQIIAGLAAFKAALGELGWVDSRNVQIDYRFAAADVDRMGIFAKELVALQPDVLLGHTTGVVAALQREAKTIPIVFLIVSDPVGSGFVESLPRPGGNITGFINIEASLSGKWIEMLKEIVPRIRRAGLMFNPATAPYMAFYQEPFEAAARSNGIEPIAAPVHTAADIERVFDSLGNRPDTGLVLPPDVFTTTKANLGLITSLAARTPPDQQHGVACACRKGIGVAKNGCDQPTAVVGFDSRHRLAPLESECLCRPRAAYRFGSGPDPNYAPYRCVSNG
jgi:putative tryptophan/tyrosine transport system substrate-binding protein